MFNDIVGDRLGLLIDGLIVAHLLALGYWAYATFREVRRHPKGSKAM
jgi:hypothetical protein